MVHIELFTVYVELLSQWLVTAMTADKHVFLGELPSHTHLHKTKNIAVCV